MGLPELRLQLAWLADSDIQKLLMPVFGYAGNVSWELAVKRHLSRIFDVDENTSDREYCLLHVAKKLLYTGNLTWLELAEFWKDSRSRDVTDALPFRPESFGCEERDQFKICAEVFQCWECVNWTRQLQFVLGRVYCASPDWRALFVSIHGPYLPQTEHLNSDFFAVVAKRLMLEA